MDKSLRIVYMGTPDFAVEPLKALLEADFNVVGVVTMPDKPAGRGHHLQASPVKQFALQEKLPVLQPERLRDEDFLLQLKTLNADVHVVVAFRMLPEVVWNMPRLGTINLHASLLPQYRGAAPINWAIINGEKETGVSTFFLKHQIDTGNIIMRETVPIDDADDAGTLHDKLMHVGSGLLVKTLMHVTKGDYEVVPQDELQVCKPAPKIHKEDCVINWAQPAESLRCFVRGMAPYPAAYTMVCDAKGNALPMKITSASCSVEANNESVGTMQTDGKTYIRFACTDGWLYADQVQLPGKRSMSVAELLRGIQIFNYYE